MIPKYYQRRLLAALVAIFLGLVSFLRVLCRDIPDSVLDNTTLAMFETSSFNPRSITYCIYSYIHALSSGNYFMQKNLAAIGPMSINEGIYFHWDDWVDLSPADKVLARYRQTYPDGKADESLRAYASVNPYYMESFNTKVLRGMANLYAVKAPPRKIWAATDSGFVEVPVFGKKKVHSSALLKQVPKLTVVSQMKRCDALMGASLPNSFHFHPYKRMQKSIDIAPQDFVFDPDKEIFALKEALNKNTIAPEDIRYLKFLETANAEADTADRFFKYPWIYTDLIAGRSHHISFPFFKRYVSDRERQSVLHHMVRVWFKFAEANGVASWINYGSLLGWAYNGVNMPWDTDIDIQMPIAQLDKLARKANSTLIIENPRDGNAKYLFEVSPTYVRQGNGRNFIDARFIDINTGLYIDISGLSHTGHKQPMELSAGGSDLNKLKTMNVHCKNWNWHSLDELLPIRHTFFEGSSVYIPHNVSSILSKKYGPDSFTTKLAFNNHRYSKELNLWVPQDECSRTCAAVSSLFENSEKSPKFQSQWIEDEYKIVSPAAERHMALNSDLDNPRDYDLSRYADLPISRKDSWEYFSDIKYKVSSNTGWYNDS
ncbi:hypothetical protein EJF18_80078 [Clavispora lusitaniae]|uniref:LicD/FKTN/FKRP nucleotidyltransferase domain-containing protein n=3 Tax=Clavispora lusitaniae TaxID=36911 RepID=C4YC42_CLAL4|nr:uncharacterized protein CLUG_05859 [Clavispora lusitaniae ATCC 42720]KAF5208692.1 hypothetical protein E0198_005200 [Clavispora lusitaniae]EEQ41731.1 hypothetical protein CLUG_05859 [Clavispora lusitaniae ATCC 42720]KAF7580490.1 LicD family protein [Clavispora lusitaniae]OVF09300.1 putative LPS biosynthesis protein [Clavispora lusitaniae]QFZ30363.1 hypothetical protein EJF14_80078 [Clavispora lusitaniae]